MASVPENSCNWSKCAAPATKHARFGNRSFGSHDTVASPLQNYTTIHRNLCDEHIAEVCKQYLDVTVFDLDGCPSCRRGAAA